MWKRFSWTEPLRHLRYHLRPSKREPVEEPQRSDHLHERRTRYLPIILQVPQVLADLLRAQIRRRFARSTARSNPAMT